MELSAGIPSARVRVATSLSSGWLEEVVLLLVKWRHQVAYLLHCTACGLGTSTLSGSNSSPDLRAGPGIRTVWPPLTCLECMRRVTWPYRLALETMSGQRAWTTRGGSRDSTNLQRMEMLMDRSMYCCCNTKPRARAVASGSACTCPFAPTAGGMKCRFFPRNGTTSGRGCLTSTRPSTL
ncbi:hypothetical protein CRUP_001066 [Coryphaenoides rupestris]|nr:hypothetical protein CRUP_001066 [Coryphaenoides rupestris]